MDTLIIIGPTSNGRAILEDLLARSGWRCLVADDAARALTIENLTSVLVVIVVGDSSVDGLEELLSVAKRAQVVFCDMQAPDGVGSAKFLDRIFGAFASDAPPWAIELTIRRAAEHAKRFATDSGSIAVELTYRKLFHASVELGTIESLQELLSTLCKEIAVHTGHGRAIIVLGDTRFRILHAGAYASEVVPVPNLSAIRGQPLAPVLPNRLWSEVGKGFMERPSTYDVSFTESPPLIIPLEREDGTVIGFLTLDRALGENLPLAELSEPIALLLRHGVQAIDAQALRAELKRAAESSDRHYGERSAELRLAQERFNRLVNLTNDIVFVTDDQGRLVYLNESFTRELGYARENYLGLLVNNVLSELAVENAANHELLARLNDLALDRLSGDLELFAKDGNRRAYRLVHNWVRQGDEIVAGQGILRDAGEQRDLQKRLAVAERLGLAGKLASGIAHEINNPLQAISAHLAGLTDRVGKDDKALASLGIVGDSVERIRLIVRSLLDLHRIEPASRSLIQLNEVVTRTHALLQPQMRQAGVVADEVLDPSLPQVVAAASEIEQVLINLILNATQAMQGGGAITLETLQIEKFVEIRVRDNGPGIAPEALKKLFEPFASFREQGGGTGLGLYVSRYLVTQHGGELRVTSEIGRGSTFTVALPLPT